MSDAAPPPDDEQVDREALVRRLRAVDRGDLSVASMREWLNKVIIGDAIEMSDLDADLIMEVVYALDSADLNAEFLDTVRTALTILTDVVPNGHAEGLLLLAWGRNRLIDVLDKRMRGLLDEADFKSFLRKRSWPAGIIQSVAALDDGGRLGLLNALRAENYSCLAGIFFGSGDLSEEIGSPETETRRLLDRREVERVLEAVATGDMSHEQLLAWAATVLAGEEYYVGETEDNDLIWHVVYGVEECSDSGREGEIVACAARYRKALQATGHPHAADALLWLAGDQDHVIEQLRTYLEGKVSREDFVASVEERAPAWAPKLIQSMLGLSNQQLGSLAGALERTDYVEVLRILRLEQGEMQ
jgi:hypothetical protein